MYRVTAQVMVDGALAGIASAALRGVAPDSRNVLPFGNRLAMRVISSPANFNRPNPSPDGAASPTSSIRSLPRGRETGAVDTLGITDIVASSIQ